VTLERPSGLPPLTWAGKVPSCRGKGNGTDRPFELVNILHFSTFVLRYCPYPALRYISHQYHIVEGRKGDSLLLRRAPIKVTAQIHSDSNVPNQSLRNDSSNLLDIESRSIACR
jgi:hypothetical protein